MNRKAPHPQPSTRHLLQGALCVAGCGGFWAAFTRELYRDGHAPSQVLLPIAREEYYRVQSLFVVPALLLLWGVLTLVAHKLTGGRQGGSARELVGPLGFAYGLPLLLSFVVPEWIAYGTFGLAGLRRVVPFTMLFTALFTCLGVAWVLRSLRPVSWRRAAGATVGAYLAQAILGSPFLR